MTATNQQPSNQDSCLHRRHTFTPLAIAAFLGLAVHVNTSATALDPPLMQGQLGVDEQRGDACAIPATLPLRLSVWAVWEDGQWWLWGDMAPMRLRSTAHPNAGGADLLPWTDETSQGRVQWVGAQAPQPEAASRQDPVGTPFTARWQENETPKGCFYTSATLRLSPLGHETAATSAPPAAAGLLTHQRLLKAALINRAALQSAASAREASEPLQSLLDLARQASALPSARQDRNLALGWLQAGEHASALRQHPQAIELLQAAWAVYEPLAAQSATGLQDAALALSSLARAQLRARQPEQAQASINRAIALLDRHQGTQTAAAASLHNQQGALWLRHQRARDALGSFARALAADEARLAPATERVATLMNSAVALEELGQTAAARAVYQRCQQLLASEPADAKSEQLAQWVLARLQALDGPGAGAVRTL